MPGGSAALDALGGWIGADRLDQAALTGSPPIVTGRIGGAHALGRLHVSQADRVDRAALTCSTGYSANKVRQVKPQDQDISCLNEKIPDLG